MTRKVLIDRMSFWADRINEQSGGGALHIFIADGNCEEEHLDFCAEQPGITAQETAFLRQIREALPEEAIYGAWALAQCEDRPE